MPYFGRAWLPIQCEFDEILTCLKKLANVIAIFIGKLLVPRHEQQLLFDIIRIVVFVIFLDSFFWVQGSLWEQF